jgi:hypothetical protein
MQKNWQSTAGIFRINFGVYLVFIGLWLLALNDYYPYVSQVGLLIGIIVGIIVAVVIIAFGAKRLYITKGTYTVNQKAKISKIVIANIFAFGLISAGVSILSIYTSQIYTTPEGGNIVYYLHPYYTQAFALFLIGSMVEFVTLSLYYCSLSKQTSNIPLNVVVP